MKNIFKNDCFQTPDLWLATCLLARGSKLVSLDKTNPNKCIFGFAKNTELDLVVKDYWLQNLTFEVSKLFEAQKFLKSKIYNE